MDLALNIDPNPDVPLFRRVAAALREAIITRRIVPGQKVPSAQELADQLDIARATVVKTYRALISQGYLEAITGSGTYVSTRLGDEFAPDQPLEPLIKGSSPIAGLSEYARRIREIRFQEPTLAGLPALNFGSPPVDCLPWEKWREMLVKYCRLKPLNPSDSSTEVFGFRPLRAAIASFLSRAKGVRCTADQVILFEGSHSFSHVARLLINPGDVAIVENPGYLGARETLSAEGAELLPADLDEEGLMVEPLKKLGVKAKLCYVTCPYQEPTGAMMSAARRQEILFWARKNCTFIVEDAFDSDYHHGSAPPAALQSLDDNGQVLYIYSFWKVLYPIVSLGALVVPQKLISVFERSKFLTNRQFPILENYALTEFISDGHLELHIKRSSKLYRARRQSLIYALSQQFRHYVSLPRTSGGLHTIVRFRLNRKSDELLHMAADAGLPLVRTSQYYVGDSRPGEFLIPFASIPEDTAEAVVHRFARLVFGEGMP